MCFKKLPVLYFAIFVSVFLSRVEKLTAQSSHSVENSEKLYEHWFNALDAARKNITEGNLPASEADGDFEVFSRFSYKSIDSLRGDFLERIGRQEVTDANVGRYESILVDEITVLYKKYTIVKNEYPSSVAEFREKERPAYLSVPCDTACDNIDFESGNLSGWNAYYAYNNSTTTNTFIAYITGGAAGSVTEAADDPLTSSHGFYNLSIGPNPYPDYQVSITSGTRGDAIVPSIPVVSPFGGHYSVMLGDSTQINNGVAILSQTFEVTPSNANFTYQYAVFLANPGHNYYQQPFFRIFFIDQAGDTIPFCGEYTVVSGHGTQQFDSVNYYIPQILDSVVVYYKKWTLVNVPLKKYVGQCITVVFEVGDCALGGHFGYAYVDASCSPLSILSSSQFFCGQDSIVLSGPAGESAYQWTGPPGGILSNNLVQNIVIDSSGTYTLVITPVTGSPCNDTLTVTIGKKPGPPPHPAFMADSVCLGTPTSFTNISNPVNGGNFYWDFYNIGSYQDSSINPTWTYNLPGTYTVKLHELVNGCGNDTTLNVFVGTPVVSLFSNNTVCPKDTVHFTNTTNGGNSFKWNFGDTASRNMDSSTMFNPTHIYAISGTYQVKLISNNYGCRDTLVKSVTILQNGNRKLTAPENICSRNSAEITASGGNTYFWNTGATTASINVSPSITTSYSCIIKNNDGCVDTAYNEVIVNTTPTVTACCDASLTPGQTIQLTSTEDGGTWSWAPDNSLNCSTCSNPVASPTETTIYTVTITSDSGCIATQMITIDVSCGEVFIPDIFSPNQASNNILFVRSPCIIGMVFMVFDRWGNKVFESESQDIGWDGHHNGRLMEEGTYVWRLTANLLNGTRIEKKGNVTLLR
jgi:gliding motility-associated-like protein